MKANLLEADQIRLQQLQDAYPTWTDEQVGTQMAIENGIRNIFRSDTSIKNLSDFTDDLWSAVLKAAEKWVYDNLPQIAGAIQDAIQVIWGKITAWLADGGLQRTLENFFMWLADVLTDSY